ncbi:MAG TPA: coenzyme F420-0:L-glutamate ligase [Actinobacteria bacterium]|nr:coenzyme F420-0:L-glutamate ligase [Actinomycetota bacterium]
MTLTIAPIRGLPEIRPGDDLAELVADAISGAGERLVDDDVVVVTHKVVSKAEGRIVPALDDAAYRRLVEQEAVAILRRRGDLVIAQTRHGFVCANAGVDRSNVEPGRAVLLPIDPDRSAHRLRIRLERRFDASLAVVVTDTFGRPWRRGLVDVAIGVSGLTPIVDLRGTRDAAGRILDATEVAVVDEIAAAADLVMGKADGIPAAIVRGLRARGDGRAVELVRPAEEDLFR